MCELIFALVTSRRGRTKPTERNQSSRKAARSPRAGKTLFYFGAALSHHNPVQHIPVFHAVPTPLAGRGC